MTDDDRYLTAAQKIREDPELPAELAPKLDELLVAVANAQGDARKDAIDDLVVTLRHDEWAAERLTALVPDLERGAPDWLYGAFQGEDAARSDLLEFTCTVCGYVNKLPHRPAEDNMPLCQNPDEASHELVLD